MTECLKTSRNLIIPFENTMKTHLADSLCLLDDRPPSIFPLYLSVYIFHYQFYKVEIGDSIDNSTELSRKNIIYKIIHPRGVHIITCNYFIWSKV